MLWQPIKQAAFVAAVAAIVMLTNLGGTRLLDRDEPRNAGCAWEMLARHDWVVPTFNAELRTHKPVLLYWCIMAAYSGLGVNEFAARLPSALGAIGSAVCVYWMGHRLFGARAGVWSGVALATSLMFVVAGRAATPDSLLILCSTLALTIYVRGTFRPRYETTPLDATPEPIVAGCYFPQHWPTVFVLYTAMGLAVLAKGPVGFVLPTAVIGLFLLIVRLPQRAGSAFPRTGWQTLAALAAPLEPLHFVRTVWSMRPFTAVFAATAIALPWYWAVGLATNGEFLRGFFLEHNLGRATATMEHHSGSVFFYPLAILVGFFPWSVFAAPLAIDTTLQLRRSDRFHAGYLLAVCWIVVYVGVFTLARTKLPSYVTPCYPALALLIGNYIDRWSRHAAAVTGGWLFAAFASLAIVGAAIAAGLPIVARKFLPGDEWLGLIGLIPLAGGIACLALYASRKQLVAAGTFGLTAGSFVLLLFTFALPRVDRQQTNDRLLAAIDARSRDPHIAAYKTLEPSWVFYGRRPIHEIGARPDAAGQETAARAASRFLAAGDTFLITTDDRLPELMPALPPHVSVLETTPYFLHHGRKLVLLGHNTPAYRITTQPTMPGRKPGLIR